MQPTSAETTSEICPICNSEVTFSHEEGDVNNFTVQYGKFYDTSLLPETKYLQTKITILYLPTYLQTILKRQKQQHHITSIPMPFFLSRERT